MNSAMHSVGNVRGWRPFFERLGVYLLLGPAVAAVVYLLLGFLTGLLYGSLTETTVSGFFRLWLLLLGLLYLVALPIAWLYAIGIALMLWKYRRVTVWHVSFCALLVSLLLYFPMLVLVGEGTTGATVYWQAFLSVFLPVFAAGVACWRVAPNMHGRVA